METLGECLSKDTTISASWIQRLVEAGLGSTDGISPVIFDDGGTTRDIDGYRPAIAYYEAALIFGTGPNRAPGDAQVLWEWNTGFATHPDPDMRDKYRQVLSKVN